MIVDEVVEGEQQDVGGAHAVLAVDPQGVEFVALVAADLVLGIPVGLRIEQRPGGGKSDLGPRPQPVDDVVDPRLEVGLDDAVEDEVVGRVHHAGKTSDQCADALLPGDGGTAKPPHGGYGEGVGHLVAIRVDERTVEMRPVLVHLPLFDLQVGLQVEEEVNDGTPLWLRVTDGEGLPRAAVVGHSVAVVVDPVTAGAYRQRHVGVDEDVVDEVAGSAEGDSRGAVVAAIRIPVLVGAWCPIAVRVAVEAGSGVADVPLDDDVAQRDLGLVDIAENLPHRREDAHREVVHDGVRP